jgi:hypothetical protein
LVLSIGAAGAFEGSLVTAPLAVSLAAFPQLRRTREFAVVERCWDQ